MMLVKLSDDVVLNPEHVVSVTRDFYDRYLLVKTILGEVHEIPPRYPETIYEAQKRVVAELSTTANSQH